MNSLTAAVHAIMREAAERESARLVWLCTPKNPTGDRYDLEEVRALADGLPVAGVEAAEAITGNFLLDPEILTVPAESAEHPLVLLD